MKMLLSRTIDGVTLNRTLVINTSTAAEMGTALETAVAIIKEVNLLSDDPIGFSLTIRTATSQELLAL